MTPLPVFERKLRGLRTVSAALVFLFAATLSPVHAQQGEPGRDSSGAAPERWGVGVFGGLQWNDHRADMKGLPGFPSCCPRYTGGTGAGAAFGTYAQAPLGRGWSFLVRLSYADQGGRLEAVESKEVFDDEEEKVIPGVVEHTIDARISSLGVEPLVGFQPYAGFGVFAGARLAAVTRARFDQCEHLVQPADFGTFENHRRTRNEVGDAGIPAARSLFAGLVAMVRYRLPLSAGGAWFLVPELSYTLALTNVASGVSWWSDGIRTALGVLFIARKKEEPPPPPPPPPEPPKPVRLEAALDAYGVDEDGRLVETPVVSIEEFETMRVWPLLPYIFFEEGSAEIPPRYALLRGADTASYSPDLLHEGNTFETYYHVLNVIGRRMREHPGAVLRITGCNAGTGREERDLELSRRRAEAVARYLSTVWGVPRSHLVVEGRGLPANPSRTDDPDGEAENRRVEISASDPEILDPLVTRSVERRITPDHIRFVPRVEADAGVREWRLDVACGNTTLRTFSGTGPPPPAIDWGFAGEVSNLPPPRDSLRYRLRVTDTGGRVRESAPGVIGVREISIKRKKETATADKIISRFNLILFDFDSPQLGSRNERVMTRFILPEIGEQSRVEIVGYTDRMGESAYNEALSRKRAENTARMLGVHAVSVQGKGENDPPYDNDLPEGRFYNRTVEILVETPR